eukprot:GFYU01000195.1.p1 GENE.GFYU01000195.1~~GFYU01000195.1.p1  ORF type:complete len:232 (-),score=58.48 GFYU01000195.1:80-775(-)
MGTDPGLPPTDPGLPPIGGPGPVPGGMTGGQSQTTGPPEPETIVDQCMVFDGDDAFPYATSGQTVNYSVNVWLSHAEFANSGGWTEVFHHTSGGNCCSAEHRVPAYFLRNNNMDLLHPTITNTQNHQRYFTGDGGAPDYDQFYMFTMSISPAGGDVYITLPGQLPTLWGTIPIAGLPGTISAGTFHVGGANFGYNQFHGSMCSLQYWKDYTLSFDDVVGLSQSTNPVPIAP